MKKLLLAAFIAAFGAAACSSGNANTKTADSRNKASAKDAKYQIIDQEFDNLLAPEADYDTLPAYELQACGDSYLPPAEQTVRGAKKPAAKVVKKSAAKKTTAKSTSKTTTTNKKVINNTNIYYLDGSAPNTSTSSSSTTTTTYTSDEIAPDTLQ